MRRKNSIAIVARFAGVVLLAFPAAVAAQDPGAGKKKADSRRVDIRVKVSTTDGKAIPAGSIVEISGQEPACVGLNEDVRATIDDNGEARFRDLPACKVTVKVNLQQYLPVRKPVDLTSYRSCADAAPPPKGDSGGHAAPACEAVTLVLEPL